MKKYVLILSFFIIVIVCTLLYSYNTQAFAKAEKTDNWKKLSNNIAINTKSINRTKDAVSAWFKRYNTKNNPIYNDNEIYIDYELVKYEAYCKTKILHLLHTKYYSKDGQLLFDEQDTSSVSAKFSAYNNGKIYYNALCKNKK